MCFQITRATLPFPLLMSQACPPGEPLVYLKPKVYHFLESLQLAGSEHGALFWAPRAAEGTGAVGFSVFLAGSSPSGPWWPPPFRLFVKRNPNVWKGKESRAFAWDKSTLISGIPDSWVIFHGRRVPECFQWTRGRFDSGKPATVSEMRYHFRWNQMSHFLLICPQWAVDRIAQCCSAGISSGRAPGPKASASF